MSRLLLIPAAGLGAPVAAIRFAGGRDASVTAFERIVAEPGRYRGG
jgi:hypothetical protein